MKREKKNFQIPYHNETIFAAKKKKRAKNGKKQGEKMERERSESEGDLPKGKKRGGGGGKEQRRNRWIYNKRAKKMKGEDSLFPS